MSQKKPLEGSRVSAPRPFDQPPNELAPKSLLKEFEASLGAQGRVSNGPTKTHKKGVVARPCYDELIVLLCLFCHFKKNDLFTH